MVAAGMPCHCQSHAQRVLPSLVALLLLSCATHPASVVAGAARVNREHQPRNGQLDAGTQRRLHLAQKARVDRERSSQKLSQERQARRHQQDSERKQADEAKVTQANAERDAKAARREAEVQRQRRQRERVQRLEDEQRQRQRAAEEAARRKRVEDQIVERRRFISQQAEATAPPERLAAGDTRPASGAARGAHEHAHAHDPPRHDAESGASLAGGRAVLESGGRDGAAEGARPGGSTGDAPESAGPRAAGGGSAAALGLVAEAAEAAGNACGQAGGGPSCGAAAGAGHNVDARARTHASYYHLQHAERLHAERVRQNREAANAQRDWKRAQVGKKLAARAQERSMTRPSAHAAEDGADALGRLGAGVGPAPRASAAAGGGNQSSARSARSGAREDSDADGRTREEERRQRAAERRSNVHEAQLVEQSRAAPRARASLVPETQTPDLSEPAVTESELLEMASASSHSDTPCSSHHACQSGYCTLQMVCQELALCTPSPGFPDWNPIDGVCPSSQKNAATSSPGGNGVGSGAPRITVAALALRSGSVSLSNTLVAVPCVDLVRMDVSSSKIESITFVYVDGSEATWNLFAHKDLKAAAEASTAKYRIPRGSYIQGIKTREVEGEGLSGMQFITNLGEASPWHGYYNGQFHSYATGQPGGSEIWALLPPLEGGVLAVRERTLLVG